MVRNTVNYDFQRIIAEKSIHRKSKLAQSMQVSIWLFWHRFSFSTVLAANFGCNQFKVIPEIVFEL